MQKLYLKTLFFSLIIFLSGCASLQHPIHRPVDLSKINAWKIRGSIGIIYANRSDIASFSWRQQQQNYAIDIHGPLNLHSAQIVGSQNSVMLRQSATQEITAKNPESLIKQEFGWELPVSNLKYWLFALPAPNTKYFNQFDKNNRLSTLDQQGWHIEYLDFQNANGIELPSKIKMQTKNLTIKLAIKSWELNSISR